MLLDPVIQVPNGSILPAISSTPRRDIWPSRDAAAERFRGSKFFQSWDPRVLDRWIEHGLHQVPTELHPAKNTGKDDRVTLTTSKHQELFNFLRPTYREVPGEEYLDKDPVADEEYPGYPFYRPETLQVFNRLPELRPSVLYIFGEKSELSPLEQREAKMARTGTGPSTRNEASALRMSSQGTSPSGSYQYSPVTENQQPGLPRRRSRYFRSQHQPSLPPVIDIPGSTPTDAALGPMQRWRDSPPETKPASLSAIADALRQTPLRTRSSAGSLNSQRIGSRAASTVSFGSGTSCSSASNVSATWGSLCTSSDFCQSFSTAQPSVLGHSSSAADFSNVPPGSWSATFLH